METGYGYQLVKVHRDRPGPEPEQRRGETRLSEVKRPLSVSEPAAAQMRQTVSLDVINLYEDDAEEDFFLRVSADGMTFEFKTQRPEDSVVSTLLRMRGADLCTSALATFM